MTLRDAAVLVAFVAAPLALLCGLGYVSRWSAGRRDQINALIKAPTWCKDRDGWMNTMDPRKAARAGERRWQETLRAQRKLRKPADPKPKPRLVKGRTVA